MPNFGVMRTAAKQNLYPPSGTMVKLYVGALLCLLLLNALTGLTKAAIDAVFRRDGFGTLVIYAAFGTMLVAILYWLDRHIPMPSFLV